MSKDSAALRQVIKDLKQCYFDGAFFGVTQMKELTALEKEAAGLEGANPFIAEEGLKAYGYPKHLQRKPCKLIEPIKEKKMAVRKRDDALYTIENKEGERYTGLRKGIQSQIGVSSSTVSMLVRGKQQTAKGWKLIQPTTPSYTVQLKEAINTMREKGMAATAICKKLLAAAISELDRK